MKPLNENEKASNISVFSKTSDVYGIKEVIDLLSHIPADQDVIFGAEMIKRTLASMNISIIDILDDALKKEHVAQDTICRLKDEIQEHMSRIDYLKNQIEHLNQELENILDAKSNLTQNDQSLQQHISSQPKETPEPTRVEKKPSPSVQEVPPPVKKEPIISEEASSLNSSEEVINIEDETSPLNIEPVFDTPDLEVTEVPTVDDLRFDDDNGLSSELSKSSVKTANDSPLNENSLGYEGIDSSAANPIEADLDAIFEDDEYEEEGSVDEVNDTSSKVVFNEPGIK